MNIHRVPVDQVGWQLADDDDIDYEDDDDNGDNGNDDDVDNDKISTVWKWFLEATNFLKKISRRRGVVWKNLDWPWQRRPGKSIFCLQKLRMMSLVLLIKTYLIKQPWCVQLIYYITSRIRTQNLQPMK